MRNLLTSLTLLLGISALAPAQSTISGTPDELGLQLAQMCDPAAIEIPPVPVCGAEETLDLQALAACEQAYVQAIEAARQAACDGITLASDKYADTLAGISDWYEDESANLLQYYTMKIQSNPNYTEDLLVFYEADKAKLDAERQNRIDTATATLHASILTLAAAYNAAVMAAWSDFLDCVEDLCQ